MKKRSIIFIIFFIFISVSCNQKGSVSDDFPLKVNTNPTNSTTETNTASAEVYFVDYPLYDYGEHVVGSETSYTFILKNNSTARASDISVDALVSPFSFAGGTYPGSGGSCGTSLSAGQQCTIIMAFSPAATTTYQKSVKLTYASGAGSKIARVTLNGEGTTASLSKTGTGNAFTSTVYGNTRTSSLTISNGGKYAASSVSADALTSPFSFTGGTYPGTSGTCSTSLADASTCTLDLSFDPTTATAYSQNLVLNYNDGYESQALTVSLTGTGLSPSDLLFASPYDSTASFGTVQVDASLDLAITISFTGDTAATSVTTSTLSAPFYYSGTGAYPGGGTCGTSISTDCTVIIKYKPTDVTENTAPFVLSFFNGVTTDSLTTNLSGLTTPELTFSNSTEDFNFCDISSTCQKAITVNYNGYSGWPTIIDMTASIVTGGQGFNVNGGTCSTNITFGVSSCTYLVDFTTSYKGKYQDYLKVSYNNTVSTRLITVPLYAQTYLSSTDVQVGSTTGGANAAGTDSVTGIAVNETNKEVFILGYTDGDLGGAANQGGTDFFLLKFDSSHDLVNQGTGSGLNSMAGNEVTTGMLFDESQYLYFTGYSDGDLNDTNAGLNDVFVSYFDRDLVHQGTTHLGTSFALGNTTGDDYSYAIAIDETGDIFIGGKTSSVIETGNIASSDDMFVVKFDGALNTTWAKMIGGNDVNNSGDEAIYGLSVNSSGDVIFAGTATGNLIETNGGNRDIVVGSLFGSSGALNWIKHYGATTLAAPLNSSGDDVVKGVIVDPRDYIYIVGNTTGNLDGNGNAGLNDIFVIWAESDGTLKNVYQAGSQALGSYGTGDDIVTGVAIDGYNNLHISGYTTGGLVNGTNGGGTDAFSVIFSTKTNTFYFNQFAGSNAAGNELMFLGNTSGVNSQTSNYFVAGSTSGAFAETASGPLDAFLSVRSYRDYTNYSPKPRLVWKSTTDDFGDVVAPGSTTKLVSVFYFGDGELLTNVTATINSTTNFKFTGGTYPGTSGTCGTNATSDCVLDLTYINTATGDHATYIDVFYRVYGDVADQSSRLILNGTGT